MGNSCLLSETLSGRQLHMREIEGDEWRSRDWWVTICAIQVQSMWGSITTTPFKKYCSYTCVSQIHILCVKSSWWNYKVILFLCRYHSVPISWCADIMVPISWCWYHGADVMVCWDLTLYGPCCCSPPRFISGKWYICHHRSNVTIEYISLLEMISWAYFE